MSHRPAARYPSAGPGGRAPSRALRILVVVDSLGGGGAERHVVELAAEPRRRGHEVAVACSVGGVRSGELEDAGVPLRPLLGRLAKRRVSAAFAARLRGLVRRGGCFDVVHAHLYASAAAAALATLATGTPLVVTEHTEAPWRTRRARWVSRFVYRRAAGIVAVSEAIRELLLADYSVPPSRLRVVTPAVPAPPDARPASPLALPEEWRAGPLVGFVGRLQPTKGADVFLRAAARVRLRVPAARFVVVGEGPLRFELEALVEQLGLGERVRFLGFRPDARRLVGLLDALAVPSRSDGTPLVVLEAMAAGVPVVASAVGGIPDVVRHGRDALLVPPGDPEALAAALLRLLGDPDGARRLGEAGRRRAGELSFERMVDEVEAVYRGALGRP